MSEGKTRLLQEHCLSATKEGCLEIFAEDDHGGVVVTVPAHRLQAIVLAAFDAASGERSNR